MTAQITDDTTSRLGPAGFYLGLRVRFAFPATEINHLPRAWVKFYSRHKLFFVDPALKWSYGRCGAIRWSDLAEDDPAQVVALARSHGLRHGAVAAYNEGDGLRSYGLFFRDDRDHEAAELDRLAAQVKKLHHLHAPPKTLTQAEIAVLRRIKDGGRLKEIAWDLGVSEGAVKQRLKNARLKLGASNRAHAAALAAQHGLI